MATLVIRDLDAAVLARLAAMAERAGRSVEAEAARVIADAADTPAAWIAELTALQDDVGAALSGHVDTLALLHAERDEA